MKSFRNWACLGSLSICYLLTGCGGGNDGYKTAAEVKQERPDAGKASHDDHGHHHHAPHHGSLTMLGDHVAQIELKVDAEAGKLEAYILDGEAEKTLAVDQKELELTAMLQATPDAKPITLKLAPAEADKPDAGFIVQDDQLKGVTSFKGTFASMKIGDKTHEKIAVEYDAKKAAAEAEEAHGHGHGHAEHAHEGDAHDDKHGDAKHAHDDDHKAGDKAAHDDDHKDEHKADKKDKAEHKHDAKDEHKDDEPAADKKTN